MGRRSTRQRIAAPPDATTVRCEHCNTRLAIIWPQDGPTQGVRTKPVDGVWFTSAKVTHGTMHSTNAIEGPDGVTRHVGLKHLAYEDWLSVRCSNGGRVWQGREGYVHDLIAGSPAGQVRLGERARPAPQPALRTTRDW